MFITVLLIFIYLFGQIEYIYFLSNIFIPPLVYPFLVWNLISAASICYSLIFPVEPKIVVIQSKYGYLTKLVKET
jgi:hypothetical protein